jgi:hypothetical protein
MEKAPPPADSENRPLPDASERPEQIPDTYSSGEKPRWEEKGKNKTTGTAL